MGAILISDAEIAIQVARLGAEVVRKRFGTSPRRIDKRGGDFATDADVEAEQAMLRFLQRERSDDEALGEESGLSGRSSGSRRWLIDPLCGTLNYGAGMRVVAVNVALEAQGRFVTAAVADPFSSEVFWADDRAFRRVGGKDLLLAPTSATTLVELNCDPPFPNARWFSAAALLASPAFASAFRPRVVSSSLALAWVASGQRAAYLTDGDMRGNVHFAAGISLCEAAGCLVTDLRGHPLSGMGKGLIAAADEKTHADLVSLVRASASGPRAAR